METKYNIGDKITFEGIIHEIRVDSGKNVMYHVEIESKNIGKRSFNDAKTYIWVEEEEL